MGKNSAKKLFQDGGINDSLRGSLFQIKILMHLAYYAHKNSKEFKLTSERKGMDKFDDLHFEYTPNNQKDNIVTVGQVKYSKNPVEITFEDLFDVGKWNKKFSLKQYFDAFVNNQKLSAVKNLVIITNNDLVLKQIASSPNIFVMSDECNNEIYFEKIEGGDVFDSIGKCFKIVGSDIDVDFFDKSVSCLLKHFKRGPNAWNITESSCKKFISKLLYVTDVQESKISEIVGKEIKKNLKLRNVDFLSKGHEYLFVDCVTGRSFFKLKDLTDCFIKWKDDLSIQNLIGLKNEYLESLKNKKIVFKVVPEIIKNFLESEDSVLVYTTSTEVTEFAAIKVFQIISKIEKYKQKDSFLMLSLEASSNSFSQALDLFCTKSSLELMVIEWNDEFFNNRLYKENENKFIDAVCEDSSKSGDQKKLIFIKPKTGSPGDIEIGDDFRCVRFNEDSPDKLFDLTDNSFDKYCAGDFVKFQKSANGVPKLVSLKKLIDVADHQLTKMIDLQDIKKIRNLGICIPIAKSFENNLFIQRKLIKKDEELDTMQLLKNSEKFIFILSDVAGSGKSNFFNYIAEEMKILCKSKWILKIDLNEHTQQLKEVAENFFEDSESAVKFLSEKIVKTSEGIERHLFSHSFYRKDKMVLLFDGLDEVSPLYTNVIISLLQTLKQKTEVSQIFLSTRPELQEMLEGEFQEDAFKFVPFGDVERKEYLTKYYESIDLQIENIDSFVTAKLNEISLSIQNLQQLISTPLITKMLAECLEYCVQNPTDTIDITKIYKNFLDKKYEIYLEKSKQDVSNIYIRYGTECILETLRQYHHYLAVKQLFDDKLIDKYHLLDGFKYNDKDHDFILKCGIVQGCKEDPKFIHKTFAEHDFAVNCSIKVDNDSIVQFLLDQIFKQSEYYMIRVFLNGMPLIPNKKMGLLLKEKSFDQLFEFFRLLVSEKLLRNFEFFHNSLFGFAYGQDDNEKIMKIYSYLLRTWCTHETFEIFLTYLKPLLDENGTFENLIREENDKSIFNDIKIFKWFHANTEKEFFEKDVVCYDEHMKNSTLFEFAELFEWEKFWKYAECLAFIKEKPNELFELRLGQDNLEYNFVMNTILYDRNGRNLLYFLNYMEPEQINDLFEWLRSILTVNHFNFMLTYNDGPGSFLHNIYQDTSLMQTLKWLSTQIEADKLEILISLRNKYRQTILFKEGTTLKILKFLKDHVKFEDKKIIDLMILHDYQNKCFWSTKTAKKPTPGDNNEYEDGDILTIKKWIQANFGIETVQKILNAGNEHDLDSFSSFQKNALNNVQKNAIDTNL